MQKYFKVKISYLIFNALLVGFTGSASAITYTYKGGSECDKGITIGAGTGVISCSTVGAVTAPKFHFSSLLSCPTGITIAPLHLVTGDPAGLDVNEVSCDTSMPSACTLVPSRTSVTPPSSIGLTANCATNAPASYKWSHNASASTAVVGVTFPDTTPPGVYAYSVTGLDANGNPGETATAYVKVESPGVTGPYSYVAYQPTLPTASSAPAGKVAVIDLASNSVVETYDVGTSPTSLVVGPRGDRVYVTSQYSNTVSVIDLATKKVKQVAVGSAPASLALNPAGTRLYVANSGADTVSVIDTTNTNYPLVKAVAVGSSPYGIAVNPAGTRIYVTRRLSPNGLVTVIDENNNVIGGPIAVGDTPLGVAVSLDGTQAYVTNNKSNTVSIINTSTNAVSTVSVGKMPYGLALNPVGTKLYVVNQDSSTFSGTVSVIDVALGAVVDTVNIGNAYFPPTAQTVLMPSFIAFNASGSLAYVTNLFSATVSIIDTASNTVLTGNSAQADLTLKVATPTPPSVWSFGQFIVADKPAFQGLWWNPNESGWGMSIAKHKNMMFSAIFTYDDAGKPTWYVMSSCPIFNISTTCVGDIYKVTDGMSPTAAWNGANLKVSVAGTGSLSFTDVDNGTFKFTLNGVAGTKTISRQPLSNGAAPAVDYTDLWWNPNESGWGIALNQQSNIIFATWYAYDSTGKAVWYVVSNCTVVGTACTGDLYTVTGGVSLTQAWSSANVAPAKVGSATFTFTDSSSGSMKYTINGVEQTRTISRQPF
ncbi:hypothetical protein BH11PSE11_BH11PSE11_38090 [soil metagenome]